MEKSENKINCIYNYPMLMKEVNNADVLERRIKLCKKRVTFTRSFLLTDSFHNASNILSPSIRKTLKYTKRLEIHCAQQTKSFSKLFPYINKLKIFHSDNERDYQRESPTVCYREIARSFHSGVWKKLKTLEMFIEDQHNPTPLRKLLISLRCNNKIKVFTADLALYLINYINNLDSILAFLTNSKNLEVLSLKNMYFLSKSFCDELSNALCKQAKLRFLELIIYDNGKKPFYNSNLTYFVECIKELTSLEALEIGFFSSSDSNLIAQIANGFKFWDRLKKVSLQFDDMISDISRETWISFYDNLSELTNLKVLSLEFLNLTLPLWRLISKSVSLLENLEELCIGFSEGMETFVRDFYSDLGAALNRFRKLKNLTLILPFTNNSYYEKIFPALKRCKLTKLKIITSMNSSQLSELESLTEFLKNQDGLLELYLDLNCSKRAKFSMFSFDATKSLLGALAKLSQLTQATLKFGGIENKFINIFKDFENLPSHLLSLNIDIRRKSLTDQELVSLIKGLNRLRYIEHFHLNADFGNITEETFSLFYRSMFQIKSVNNVNIQAVNAILPGIVYLK